MSSGNNNDDGIDLYSALGVPRNATKEEIKSAYRSIAQKCHPDKSDDIWDTVRFHRVQHAYDVLMDDLRRARYDATGDTKQPDLNALVLEELGRLALQVVEQCNTDYINIIAHMHHVISSTQDQLRVQYLKQQQDIRRRERVAKRLIRNDDDVPDVIRVAIERDTHTRTIRLQETEVKISQATKMLEILSKYHDTLV